MKKYRLTESELRNMVREAVNDALMNEGKFTDTIKNTGKKIASGVRKAGKKAGELAKKGWEKWEDEVDKIDKAPAWWAEEDDDLEESRLRESIKSVVRGVLKENEPDLYDTLSRPDGKLDLSNPYTWARSPKMLKDMGYDENGMKDGKKYYDNLINPDWRFNTDQPHDRIEYVLDPELHRNHPANIDARKEEERNKRWDASSDLRSLHRKGSLNRDIPESLNRRIDRIVKESIRRNLR